LRIYGLSRGPAVVHNGRRRFLPELRASGEDFVFTAGRLWDDGKNMRVLDRAAPRIRLPIHAAGPLCGPTGEAAAFEHLHCLGRMTERAVFERLARRPIFVSPSLYEPFGLAVLEAAAAGCALALSDIPTFRELWDGAAVFAPPHDAAALAAAVNALVDDPARRSEAGARARRRAQRYAPERMTRAMMDLYQGLASTPRLLTAVP
jgi:glycosyltransferase involved in cell wall biosynthesis